MATSKKPTSANKHKAAVPKKVTAKPSASTARAMDIIPKNRVRPTTTSRPVITTSTPAVADNTLTSPSSTPALQVKRRRITINPPQDSEISKDDVMPNLAASAPEVAAPADPTPAPSAQGVSVSDLIAKRKEKVVVAEPTEEVTASSAEEATEPAITAEDSPTPGTTPELPATESSVDDPAAAEAARLLSDAADDTSAPVTEVTVAPAPEEAVVDEQAGAKSATAPVETEAPAQDIPVKTSVAEATASDPAPESPSTETTSPAETKPAEDPKPAEPAAADSVGEILKEETAEPQEHSQALKDEIKTMNEKGTTHHELYGGQPVIVVHKERGPMSAVAWVLWFFLCLGVALLIVNFLLDAGFIVTNYKIPHTNIL